MESSLDFSSFPSEAIVIVDGKPYISQLRSDGASGLLNWVAIEQDQVESYVVRTKLRMMGAMLLDEARNLAYEKTLLSCIKPGSVVLDAGAGTGLLSMMAARCGAKKVYACEMNEYFAAVAERIVKDNGLEEVIEVIPKRTSELTVGIELAEKVDIIVSETMDSVLTTEGIIQTLRDAKDRLGKPDCQVVPRRGLVLAHLIECRGTLLDFYEQAVKSANYLNIELSSDPLYIHADCDRVMREMKFLSAEFEAVRLDFDQIENNKNDERSFDICIEHGGFVHGLLMYWRVDLNDETSISTALDEGHCWQDHWHHALYFFDHVTEVAKGHAFPITVVLNQDNGEIAVKTSQKGILEEHSRVAKRAKLMPTTSIEAAASVIMWWDTIKRCFERFLETSKMPVHHLIDFSDNAGVVSQLIADIPDMVLRFVRHQALANSSVALYCGGAGRLPRRNQIEAALQLLYRCANLKEAPTVVFPSNALIKCCLVQFNDLKNPRINVNSVSGFSHVELFRNWKPRDNEQPWSFPINLFNYTYQIASADPIVITTMDFAQAELKFSQSEVELVCQTDAADAVVFWVQWEFRIGEENVANVLDVGSPLKPLTPLSYCQCQFLNKQVEIGQHVQVACELDVVTNRLSFLVT